MFNQIIQYLVKDNCDINKHNGVVMTTHFLVLIVPKLLK